MKMRPSTYLVITTLVVTAVVIAYSLTYPYLESKLLPVLVGSILFILTGIQLIKELRLPEDTSAPMMERAPEYGLIECAPSAAWIVGLCLAIYLFGFMASIPVFVIAYIKSHGRGWSMAIGVAASLTAFIYVVFIELLQVDLHPGLFMDFLS
ncbi:MAG: hypothetical protein A3G25_02075 [Betaproteobacteria bacterium RIFCSPLOWO2_12_FULL_63_13]|nr:MAG: hypothetical protein A3H32_03715 [Betaproteobacteria bacterium RIFCSPLOWO2_02_FULL_63_19]OGA45901.1 MAG: hypothetical protein A3G25_02075 [Betaproteobacteria bacterium RIFCSPLOWO2_12_FULL_63_13]